MLGLVLVGGGREGLCTVLGSEDGDGADEGSSRVEGARCWCKRGRVLEDLWKAGETAVMMGAAGSDSG